MLRKVVYLHCNELKLAEAIIEENREIITARWNEFFKKH